MLSRPVTSAQASGSSGSPRTKDRSIFKRGDRQPVQRGDARVAGAEVVERQRDAEVGKPGGRGERRGRRLQDRGLGDLDLQPAGLQPDGLERLRDRDREVGLGQVARRDVDAHGRSVGPRGRVGAGLPQHPLAHVGDQPALLGDTHERCRLEQSVHRVLPAHQGLAGLDRAVGQPHDRLVEDAQLALVQRPLELGLQGQVVQRDSLRGLVEDVDPRPALLLGAVHRGVGLVQQASWRRARCRPSVRSCTRGSPAPMPGRTAGTARRAADRPAPGGRCSSTFCSHRTTNSSPPRRTAVSPSRTATDSRVATWRSTSSPAS